MNDTLKNKRPVAREEPTKSRPRWAARAARALFEGQLERDWTKFATTLIKSGVPVSRQREISSRVINLLPGAHETRGAVAELKETVEAFGFGVRVLQELASGPEAEARLGSGFAEGAGLELARMGSALRTVAIGEHMRQPARLLRARTGVPVTVLPSVIGLEQSDRLVALLSRLSGRSVPTRVAKQRGELLEAMATTQPQVIGKRVAIIAEPDLLRACVRLFERLGADVPVALNGAEGTTGAFGRRSQHSHSADDWADLSQRLRESEVELLVASGFAQPLAEGLGIPLFLIGSPVGDRVCYQYRAFGGYRGTREFVSEIGDVFGAPSPKQAAERARDSLLYFPAQKAVQHAGA